jgi:hypothetical protein
MTGHDFVMPVLVVSGSVIASRYRALAASIGSSAKSPREKPPNTPLRS